MIIDIWVVEARGYPWEAFTERNEAKEMASRIGGRALRIPLTMEEIEPKSQSVWPTPLH
jgi:hypothetical protein